MDRFSFLGSVHAEFIDEQYQRYLSDPDNTEPSWRAFFQGYDFAQEVYSEDYLEGAGVPQEVIKEFHVLNLIQGYRSRGHLFTKTNPVRERREYQPTLHLENFGLSRDDFETEFNAAVNRELDRKCVEFLASQSEPSAEIPESRRNEWRDEIEHRLRQSWPAAGQDHQ